MNYDLLFWSLAACFGSILLVLWINLFTVHPFAPMATYMGGFVGYMGMRITNHVLDALDGHQEQP